MGPAAPGEPRRPGIGSAALERVKSLLAQLPDEERAELASFLADLGEPPRPAPGAVPLAADRSARKPGAIERRATLRREWVRCGKKTCRCRVDDAARHGPYLYHYWWENGRTRKAYAGRG